MKYEVFQVYVGIKTGKKAEEKGFKINFTYAQGERIIKNALKIAGIECATITQHAKGLWKSSVENTLVITLCNDLTENCTISYKVCALVRSLKEQLMQDAILVLCNENIQGNLL